MRMRFETKKLTVLAMLSVIAYLAMVVFRIPVVSFLKYEPKDIVMVIGGFIYGPLSVFAMSFVVSFVEMITVSDTGVIGFVMNVLSTCAFACTASFIYKKKHNMTGAIMGLAAGLSLVVVVMLLWNYFLTPIYMGVPRNVVADMLIPVFLPFNLIKGGLNSAMAILLYKLIITALRKLNLMPPTQTGKSKVNVGAILLSCFIIISCILFILILQEKI